MYFKPLFIPFYLCQHCPLAMLSPGYIPTCYNHQTHSGSLRLRFARLNKNSCLTMLFAALSAVLNSSFLKMDEQICTSAEFQLLLYDFNSTVCKRSCNRDSVENRGGEKGTDVTSDLKQLCSDILHWFQDKKGKKNPTDCHLTLLTVQLLRKK